MAKGRSILDRHWPEVHDLKINAEVDAIEKNIELWDLNEPEDNDVERWKGVVDDEDLEKLKK